MCLPQTGSVQGLNEDYWQLDRIWDSFVSAEVLFEAGIHSWRGFFLTLKMSAEGYQHEIPTAILIKLLLQNVQPYRSVIKSHQIISVALSREMNLRNCHAWGRKTIMNIPAWLRICNVFRELS